MNEQNLAKSAPNNRSVAGPFDRSEIVDASIYINFGSILLLSREGLQVRLDVEPDSDRIVAISLDFHESTLQLQAFAAPKSEGVWHSVRASLADSVLAQGGQVEERLGSLGLELVAKTPVLNEGKQVVGQRFARFVGVDGPRWFLRGVIGGAAINDPAAAVTIEEIFRSIVVDRGESAVPPRELLPLSLPAGVVLPPKNSSSR